MRSAPLRFLHAHATHPHPELALEIVWAQLASQGATTMEASLGWCYLTEAYSDHAEAVLDSLRARLPGVAWVGAWASVCWPPGWSTSTSPPWC